MEKRENKKQNDGKVVCEVKNCVYHKGECDCTAERIAIGPTFATESTDTVCATFKPKNR